MADEFQTLNIIISGLEDTGAQIKLKDQNNRTYSFFKNKKDGGETIAFQNFKSFKIGDTVELAYKEVPYKDGTIKNVIGIRQGTGQPHAEAVLNRGRRGKTTGGPGREYWEQREAKRQNSIVLQVAFKAAVELQSANMNSGGNLDKNKIYEDTLEFYDWIMGQVGDGINQTTEKNSEALDDAEKPF